MPIRSVNKKGRISQLWMANLIMSWKPPEAKWLWNGVLWGWLSPLCPHTARPAAMGWSQGLTSLTEALSKASCGIVPRDSHQGRPIYNLWIICYETKHQKRHMLRAVRPSRIWALLQVVLDMRLEGTGSPSHSLAHHSYSFKPIILFQKLPWLKRN